MSEKEKIDSDAKVVEAIRVLAMNGIYPKEAYSILESFLESYGERPVFHDGKEIPHLGDLMTQASELGQRVRSEERRRRNELARSSCSSS